jgi:hypothetical protein
MRPIMVEIRPGVYVRHSLADYVRLFHGVDLEAARAAVAPLETEGEDDAE